MYYNSVAQTLRVENVRSTFGGSQPPTNVTANHQLFYPGWFAVATYPPVFLGGNSAKSCAIYIHTVICEGCKFQWHYCMWSFYLYQDILNRKDIAKSTSKNPFQVAIWKIRDPQKLPSRRVWYSSKFLWLNIS